MNAPRAQALAKWLAPNSTLQPALVSSLLCWLAFPPVGWGWLVWVAPIGWLVAVQRAELPGTRPYRKLWLAGFTFWLLTVHWIRLPHPANYLAWVVLASYLGIYLPTFVALSRVGVHRLRLPCWLVTPVVWTGLDWFRHHLMTGFGFGSLAHTQADYPWMIQIANLFGEYGVTFLVVLVAACVTECCLSWMARPELKYLASTRGLHSLVPGVVAIAATLGYGALEQEHQNSVQSDSTNQPSLRVALIQGNTLADWKGDADKQQRIMAEYMQLSLDAAASSRENDGRDIDLFVWPETSFRQTLATVEPGYEPPPDMVHESFLVAGQRDLAEFVRQTGAAILTGIDRVEIYPTDHGHADFKAYNSSVLMNSRQQIIGTYDKMHRVPFGEYIPFADWIPALYSITPVTGGVHAGERVALFNLGDFFIAPNICYETCVPHLIRRQAQLQNSAYPDVLVNLSNNAWYWGSSELEMHLACGVFRAVETRTPLVIAANSGLSAHVDAFGNVLQVTARQQTASLLVDVTRRSGGSTCYTTFGDWFASVCVVCCVVLAIVDWRGRASGEPSDASPRG